LIHFYKRFSAGGLQQPEGGRQDRRCNSYQFLAEYQDGPQLLLDVLDVVALPPGQLHPSV